MNRLLQEAGVSRNAYYSLARKDTVLPNSLIAIAARLGVKPSSFLDEEDLDSARFTRLLAEVEQVLSRHRQADRDNVRHTLLLLQEKPIERLRRSLTRGQRLDFYRPGG